ncbi:MAG: DUF2231 domain-containing protein [bacterium]|nr:DUF2231 domain-containing protein [bacterium]
MKYLLHPLAVHFPVALWLTSALLDLLYVRTRDLFHFRAARGLIGLGLLGALVSVATGFADALPLVAEGVGQVFVDRHRVHQVFAYLATLLYTVSFLIRWRRPSVGGAVVAALMVAGAVLIAVTGWLGGELRLAM